MEVMQSFLTKKSAVSSRDENVVLNRSIRILVINEDDSTVFTTGLLLCTFVGRKSAFTYSNILLSTLMKREYKVLKLEVR